MARQIKGIPFERMTEKQVEGYEEGWVSPPGVTPMYRARLGHGEPNKKSPLRRKADGSGPWYFQAQVRDGSKWVVCAIGKLGDVAKVIADTVKGSLQIPEPVRVAESRAPSRAKRAKKAKKAARKNGRTTTRKATAAEQKAGRRSPAEKKTQAEQEAVNPS